MERRFSTLQKTFRFFDVSQDNQIQYEEFDAACLKLGLKFTQAEKQMVFKRIDSDNDGQFTYDDFVRCAGDKRELPSKTTHSREVSGSRQLSQSTRHETASRKRDPLEEELDKRREKLGRLKDMSVFAKSKQDKLFDI